MRKKGQNQKTDTIIGDATSFKGTIISNENIRIDGKHEGELTTQRDLVISESGQVKGVVQAANILLGGSLEGEMKSAHKVMLLASASFQGKAEMLTLIIEEGAFFQGECRQKEKRK
ncbi:MAG: polymer-forming cytoskeletal protein [Firmicutes bacterium]|nr:polymer-forming cytoskeletal protein [Bacillota bacterium]